MVTEVAEGWRPSLEKKPYMVKGKLLKISGGFDSLPRTAWVGSLGANQEIPQSR